MNQHWSDLNKQFQQQLKNSKTFREGINTLLLLREELMAEILQFRAKLSDQDYKAMPFIDKTGYHSKSIAYSLYHIFRIEDIVSQVLIKKDEQIFNRKLYQKQMNSSIITTGNELKGQEIADFSRDLKMNELYQYISEVYQNTNQMLLSLNYNDLKCKMSQQDRAHLLSLKVVSEDQNAIWLLDYWCGKTIRGLLQMPLSRHWIMHIEACFRILEGIKRE